MKVFYRFVFVFLLINTISYSLVDAALDKYMINFENDKYVNNAKVKIINNDFMPVIEKYSINEFVKNLIKKDKSEINIINLNISRSDMIALFRGYYGPDRKTEKNKINTSGFILDDGQYLNRFNATLTHKGSYSSQSLKIGFGINIDDDDRPKSGFFEGKEKLRFNHLMYDLTGANEQTYYKTYKEIYTDIFDKTPYHVDGKYYWLFINSKLYGYYFVADQDKKDLLLNNGSKKKQNQCIIKAKRFDYEYRANLDLNYMKNKDAIMTKDDMDDIFVIKDEASGVDCLAEFRELIQKINDGDINWILNNFENPAEIYLWGRYLIETNSFGGINQNYLLIKQLGKWSMTLWDGDLTLLPIDKGFTMDSLKENKLIDLIYKNKKLLDGDTIELIDSYDYDSRLKHNLSESFYKNIDDIFIDRTIWYRYIKRDIEYRPIGYLDYAYFKMSYEKLKESLVGDYLGIYFRDLSLFAR